MRSFCVAITLKVVEHEKITALLLICLRLPQQVGILGNDEIDGNVLTFLKPRHQVELSCHFFMKEIQRL